jgi:hypothetical protein
MKVIKKALLLAALFGCAVLLVAQEEDTGEADAESVTREEFVELQEALRAEQSVVDELEEEIRALREDVNAVPSLIPSITGSATMEFGIDLNTFSTGFVSSAPSTIELVIVPQTTRQGLSRGDVRGYIELTNFSINLTEAGVTGARPGILAQILVDDWTFQLWSLPTPSADQSNGLEVGESTVGVRQAISGGGGFSVGTEFPFAGFELALGTPAGFTANQSNTYAVGLTSALKFVEQLPSGDFRTMPGNDQVFNVLASLMYDTSLGNPDPFNNVATDYNFTSGDFGVSIQPVLIVPTIGYGMVTSLAVDYAIPSSDIDSMGLDARFDIRFNLSENAIIAFVDQRSHIRFAAYYNPADITTWTNADNLDLELVFEELGEGHGLSPEIGAEVSAKAFDLFTNRFEVIVETEVSYNLGDFEPYLGVSWDSGDNVTIIDDDFVGLTIGTSMNFFPRTTFNLEYSSGAINRTDALADLGVIVFSASVAY